jgi:hypothetical protein
MPGPDCENHLQRGLAEMESRRSLPDYKKIPEPVESLYQQDLGVGG